MKEFTSLTPVSKIQLNHQPGPHSPQPQSVSERPLERPTLVRPQRTSTVLIQNNEANQVKLSWITRLNANWYLDLKCCSLEKVTALVIHSGVWMHLTVVHKRTAFDEFCCLLLLSENLGGPIGSLACGFWCPWMNLQSRKHLNFFLASIFNSSFTNISIQTYVPNIKHYLSIIEYHLWYCFTQCEGLIKAWAGYQLDLTLTPHNVRWC